MYLPEIGELVTVTSKIEDMNGLGFPYNSFTKFESPEGATVYQIIFELKKCLLTYVFM